MICELCGKFEATTRRWYQYDNGEQFIANICYKCSELHSQLLKGSK